MYLGSVGDSVVRFDGFSCDAAIALGFIRYLARSNDREIGSAIAILKKDVDFVHTHNKAREIFVFKCYYR